MAKLNALSKKILELRKLLNMTQTDLAQKVGVSKGAISHFEKGSSKPSGDTLAKLSEALGDDLRRHLSHIGAFPVLSTDDNQAVAIIQGNQYDRVRWDYLRRSESDLPYEVEESEYAKSKRNYAFPALSLPDTILDEGTHIAFPISGNQMAPLFEEGDLLIFTLALQIDWSNFPEDSNYFEVIDKFPIYAIETRSSLARALYIGRFSVSPDKTRLRCYYDDRTIPQSIPISDVVAVWKYKWVLSNRSRNAIQPLSDRIRELEYEINRTTSHGIESKADSRFFTYRERLAEMIAENIDIVGKHRSKDFFTQQMIIDLTRDKELEELYSREYNGVRDFKKYYEEMGETLRVIADSIASETNSKRKTP